MLLLTSLEAMRELLRLNGRNEHPDAEESGVTLVLPGTCSYIFWQLGMIQYLCEHFDTRSAKLAGVSSGAVSAVMLLHMEEIAQKAAAAEKDSENAGLAAAAAARQRAQEVFEIIEGKTAELMRTPLSFFGRLGQLMEDLAPRVLPEGDAIALGSRLQIGVRRLATGVVPALVPDVVGSFTSRDELLDGVLASCNVWLVVRLHPCRFLPSLSAFCSDGVNPYSLYCFWDYLCQRLTGQAEISAPHEMHGGILDRIYAIWNCTLAVKVLLPSSGKRLWVSPTVGGRLNVMYLLRFSGWFIGEQWQQGYAHARDLDARGYWQALPRRPGM
ncbi:Hypothetical protein SCF082_LOCUS23945 [Durusdinium trenchii]|uniref:PNPLA domain-containing protein n=1 Tax=Durusdinium trenchii TaxID=1381693 RepID=A0ABP0LRP3_9DINO